MPSALNGTHTTVQRNYEESNGTLKFATFSASVINKVTVNVVADSGAMLKEYKGEIEELKLTAGKAEGRLKDIRISLHTRTQARMHTRTHTRTHARNRRGHTG